MIADFNHVALSQELDCGLQSILSTICVFHAPVSFGPYNNILSKDGLNLKIRTGANSKIAEPVKF